MTTTTSASVTLTADEIAVRAAEAYVYFYPLVTMDLTRLKFTDVAHAGPGHGPTNTIAHLREFPPADFRAVVAPNFDTLYSMAWIDLADGPLVLEVPDSAGRHYLLPFLDMWTDAFAVPGKRTTGTAPGRFVLVPPGWQGELPADATPLHAPTPVVWLLGRTQTNGVADYGAVHAFQDGFALRTLGGAAPTAGSRASALPEGVDITGDPLQIADGLAAVDYFAYAARLMAEHAPHATDFSQLARLAPLGLVPGDDFDPSRFDDEGLAALQRGATDALAVMRGTLPHLTRVTNGWSMNTDTMGVYGNFYVKRAVVTMIGLGANPAEDAIYPLIVTDGAGNPVVGEKDYVQHFAADELPPVGAFWSVTMYDAESFQFPNPLGRFALGDRDPLHYNADGSLDMYYGPTDPGGDASANWLPAPAGPLRVMLRLYAPKPEALDGRWNPPALAVR